MTHTANPMKFFKWSPSWLKNENRAIQSRLDEKVHISLKRQLREDRAEEVRELRYSYDAIMGLGFEHDFTSEFHALINKYDTGSAESIMSMEVLCMEIFEALNAEFERRLLDNP